MESFNGCICARCGAAMEKGQSFCIKCGAPKGRPDVRYCQNCGVEMEQGDDVCSKCGHRVAATASATSLANQPSGLEVRSKKRNPKLIAIITAAVVVVGVAAFFIISSVQAQNAKAAADAYIEDVKTFANSVLDAGVNLEDIADTCQSYWYDAIWNDMYLSDINVAISRALLDKSGALTDAKDDYSRLQTLYDKVKKVPDGVDDEDVAEIRDAVKAMYDTYTDYYRFATNPSGTYNSFSEDNRTKTDDFLSKQQSLYNLLD